MVVVRGGGGCCLKYTLKGGGTEKRGGDTKILKIGGQAGSGVDALKRGGGGGLEPPYKLWIMEEKS